MSRSLFHYQTLREDYLTTLLAKRTVRLSRPDAFNDPWDCRVHFTLPGDQQGRRRLVQWLAEQHRQNFPEMTEAERNRTAQRLMSEPATLEAAFTKMEATDVSVAVPVVPRLLPVGGLQFVVDVVALRRLAYGHLFGV